MESHLPPSIYFAPSAFFRAVRTAAARILAISLRFLQERRHPLESGRPSGTRASRRIRRASSNAVCSLVRNCGARTAFARGAVVGTRRRRGSPQLAAGFLCFSALRDSRRQNFNTANAKSASAE